MVSEDITEYADNKPSQPTPHPELEDSLTTLERFTSLVTINGDYGPFWVGPSDQDNDPIYHLFELANSDNPFSYVGTLRHEKRLANSESGSLYNHFGHFSPTEGSPDEITVTTLDVKDTDRLSTLEERLTEIRTHLTDTDWAASGQPRTSYGEWLNAAGELADFYQDHAEELPPFDPQLFYQPRIMHSVARYPEDVETMLGRVATVIENEADDGYAEYAPDAFRVILIAYADSEDI